MMPIHTHLSWVHGHERNHTTTETTKSSICSSSAAEESSTSSSGDAARTGSPGESHGSRRVDYKRKEDGEPEDPEREDGKWMRTEGNKRKPVEEQHVEESLEIPGDVGEHRGEEGIPRRHWR